MIQNIEILPAYKYEQSRHTLERAKKQNSDPIVYLKVLIIIFVGAANYCRLRFLLVMMLMISCSLA